MRRIRGIHLVVFVVTSLASGSIAIHAQADSSPVWTYTADCGIRWFRPTPPGILLVGTEREILGIAPDSGSVIWRLGPITNSNGSDVELLAHSATAVFSLKNQGPGLPPLSLIDLRDGSALWTSATVGVTRSIGSFLIPGTDKLLLRGTLSSGEGDTAMLLELASGVPIWTNAGLARHRFPYMYKHNLVYPHYSLFMDTDTTMIVATWDRLFVKFNLGTGEDIWEAIGNPSKEPNTDDVSLGDTAKSIGSLISMIQGKDVKEEEPKEKKPPEIHEFDFRYGPILESAEGERFYAPYKGTVAAFSMINGDCLWPTPPMLNGLAAQMAELPEGLLVRVVEPSGKDLHQRVVLLDRGTGAVKWKWPDLYWDGASNFVVEDDRVVIAAEGKIRAVDFAGTKAQTVAKLEFDDIDDPNTLLVVPNGYVVIGRSNLGVYAKEDGKRIKKYYRPPPSDEGWGTLLLGLSLLTYSPSSVDVGSGVKVSGGLDPMLGLNKIMKDYSSSSESEDYVYFLADTKFGDEKGTGIVRVMRETGDVAGQILLGKKKPDYALGEGQLYFKPDSKSLRCHRF
jgi:hypothetical protein